MVAKPKGVLEDALAGIMISDFSGGLVTTTGALSLESNQTPDMLNLIPFPGKLKARGGVQLYCALPASCDALYQWYDYNGNRRITAWSGGLMYGCETGRPIVYPSLTYTVGQSIARQELNGKLYWTELTQPSLNVYDAVANTNTAVTGSGEPGSVTPPPCSWLLLYNGSLIALNPVLSSVNEWGTFLPSNVNDPTTWIAANLVTPGGADRSLLTFGIPMGIANPGVSPSRSFIVGRSKENMFMYSGATTELVETQVSCSVGCLDGKTAVYIPDPTNYGYVIFLGTDYQLYSTNGIQCECISQQIFQTVYNNVNSTLVPQGGLGPAQIPGATSSQPNGPFNAAYNSQYQYYVCDFGQANQLAYRWQTKAWSAFQGWYSGIYMSGTDNFGFPAVFVGGASQIGLWQMGVDYADDNGVTPSIYYRTPYLHGGNFKQAKDFQWLDIAFTAPTSSAFNIYGLAAPRFDGLQLSTETYKVTIPPLDGNDVNGLVWNIGLWNEEDWSGTSTTDYNLPPVAFQMRLACPVSNAVAASYGRAPGDLTEPLIAGAAQFTVQFAAGPVAFDLVSIQLRCLKRGERRTGNQLYNAEAGVSNTNTYINPNTWPENP
jgi:hypothetical protein